MITNYDFEQQSKKTRLKTCQIQLNASYLSVMMSVIIELAMRKDKYE